METINVTHEGAIDWLCLNRPSQLNAIDPLMCEELLEYFTSLQTNRSVRVVIFHGAGRAFCAGYDLGNADGVSAAGGVASGLTAQQRISEVTLRMRRCPQPIICLAHGATVGGGFAFALASDVRIAADDVRFSVAMIKVGLSGCDVGISYFLPRAVGSSLAAELMMTGRDLRAERALSAGLVSAVSAPAELMDLGRAMAADMLKTSALGLRLTKEGLRMSFDAQSLEAAVMMEDRGQVLCASAGLMREGIAAFRERRAPQFPDDT